MAARAWCEVRPFLFAVVLVTAGALPALGCVCAGVPNERDSLASADAVFEGTAVAKRIVLTKDWDDWYRPSDEYTFAVARTWKGSAEPERILIGGSGGCDEHFAPGGRYVIYAVRRDRHLMDLACGVTHRVASGTRPPPPRWYRHRAYLVAGAAILANLVTHGLDVHERVAPAATGMVTAGMLCTLLPLVGVATSFRKPRRALIFGLLVLALIGVTLFVAGRIAISDPRNPSELVWPLTYDIPEHRR